MSQESLERLQRQHAFDPAPRRDDLEAYHVPFDELTGDARTEAELARAVRVPERVAVVGPSGGGKSSLIFATLGPLAEGIAPVRIPVAAESDDVVTSPQEFAAHLVRVVSGYAREAQMLSEDERRTLLERVTERRNLGGRDRSVRVALTPSWLAADLELSAELRSVTEAQSLRRSASEVIDGARDVLGLIGEAGLIPVVVIDDSDAWLQIAGVPDRSPLIAGFFSRTVRTLAEEMPAAVVVAVHEGYLPMEAYRRASGFIETTIEVPELPGPEALAAILARRVAVHTGSELGEAFEPPALDELFSDYVANASRNLRRVMLVAHTALQAACADGLDQISGAGVATAIVQCEPGYGGVARTV